MKEGPDSIARVLRVISDDKLLMLFRTIAHETTGIDASRLIEDQKKFTCKQYYSRMKKMQASGLVRRKSGKYFLTPFGKVISETLRIAENGLENYWKLKTGISFDNL
ncbi:MAG: hypothetical protein ABI347_08585 [Nitrososphaera sp.]|jgi:predicted transcriptional regulator